MKKSLIITAAVAAFLLLPIFFGTAAYAFVDEPHGEEQDVYADGLPDDYTDNAPAASAESEPVIFTPSGAASVVDHATDADGKLFFTIMTPDEHIFYLVIDKQRGTENVYFLNAVTVADLMPLAQMPEPPQGGMTAVPPETVDGIGELVHVEPAPEYETEQSRGVGIYILIAALAIAGGGAGWYFKIYRPKQEAANDSEYEPELDNGDNGYSDDWGEDADADSGDTEDAPPLEEDEE